MLLNSTNRRKTNTNPPKLTKTVKTKVKKQAKPAKNGAKAEESEGSSSDEEYEKFDPKNPATKKAMPWLSPGYVNLRDQDRRELTF